MKAQQSIALAACLVSAATFAQSTVGNAAELTRGPYLQLATPESMVVVWRTEGPATPVLKFGPSVENLTEAVSGEDILLRVSADVETAGETPLLYKEPAEDAARRDADERDPSTSENTYQYEAYISGLEPQTKYFYAIFDGSERLAGGEETATTAE